NKQSEEILLNLYRFRFLTRVQIQWLLNQKYYSRLVIWLDDLIKMKMVKQFYESKKIGVAAIYSLDNEGRKYLKALGKNKLVLDKIWREKQFTNQFKYHCLAVADSFINLKKTVNKANSELSFYTKNELIGLRGLPVPHPDAYFYIEEVNGQKKYYFLDVLDGFINKQKIKNRINLYLDYFDENIWQEMTGKIFPEIIFVVGDTSAYFFLKNYLRQILTDDEVNFYLISLTKMKYNGFNRQTLNRVEMADD
ncbi:hypothetical protein EOM09_06455, partial [bacterium]|nr:hypothetical protein [bacterium]